MGLGDWLGLAGIAIAIVQIAHVGRTVSQVREAVLTASAQASIYNVLTVAPRMSGIEHQLDLAARHNDVETFSLLLRSYKDLAAELDGLLHQEKKHSEDAQLKLQKSLVQVTAAKIPMSVKRSDDLYARTRLVRRSISEASIATVQLTARLRSDLVPVEVLPKRRLLDRVFNRRGEHADGI
ncbi:hypothetical protein [Mycolicibacterium sp. D5.8-2]|uniref:hypothetical protein n=1 Tax=Mycolicibacterium sp. D5.8-2 TaxID=3085903 RepID=UPI00298C8E68|nr:hypothetical protein [Mycolicibacterium sp. D5.8-2]MDW5610662.1 hypothetical protein [Mycolicibacterium sp. D5.8-2]